MSIKEIQVQFQGGFVGKECQLEGGPSTSSLTPFYEFYPDDVNSVQVSFLKWSVMMGIGKSGLISVYSYVYLTNTCVSTVQEGNEATCGKW